jgi:hypothetical protein
VAFTDGGEVTMGIFRVGASYRATFDSGLRHVLVGIIPGRRANTSPRLIPLPMHRDGSAASVDPSRVRDEVLRAVRDAASATGAHVCVEAIEYVPNDSPYYEKYYTLAYNLILEICGGR